MDKGDKNMPKHDKIAESECEIRLICTSCKRIWPRGYRSIDIRCPDCEGFRYHGFRCTKCGYAVATYFGPRICPKCHPELFSEEELLLSNPNDIASKPTISLSQKIRNSKVTNLSDEPKGEDYTQELWMEWYNKLDEASHEKLRDMGNDPFDPWR